MAITQVEAWIYLPFVLPICFYVAFTDLREMRITNQAVLVLGGLFVVLALLGRRSGRRSGAAGGPGQAG